jgi:hypothetical protein
MIKFEYNMLVLNNAFSEEDVHQINAFADYVRSQERERIIALLEPNGVPEYWVERLTHLLNGDSK